MTGPAHTGRAILLGCYAAGVALAPSWTLRAAGAALLFALPASWWILSGANHWISAFLAAAILLPPLPIPIGNSGPHPSLLVAASGLVVGILRAREWTIRFDRLAASFLVFFSILLASTASAAFISGGGTALGSIVRVMLFGISLYVYFYTVYGPGRAGMGSEIRAVRWLSGAAILAALFAWVDFYFQFPAPAGYGAQFVWLASGVFRRAQGLFYEASTLGNFSAFFLVLIAVLIPDAKRWPVLPRAVMIPAGAVLFAALMLSYSRASIAALMAAIGTLVFLQAKRSGVRYGIILIPFSLAAGALVLLLLLPEFTQIYLRRMTGSFEYFFSDTNAILSGRLESWRAVLRLLEDNPHYLLTGIGYKTLPYTNLAGRPLVADNMYLSLLIETGVAGLAAFVWMNICILRASYAAAVQSNRNGALLGTWFFCFWVGELFQMLSGDLLTYWRVLPIYFWVLAAALRSTSPTYEHPLR
ncbi:MAG: O-antigen ligase family protein [Acidobacteria bacterium]|nr:O-antigen ligase family protein [Acidobacteriota bacterium]